MNYLGKPIRVNPYIPDYCFIGADVHGTLIVGKWLFDLLTTKEGDELIDIVDRIRLIGNPFGMDSFPVPCSIRDSDPVIAEMQDMIERFRTLTPQWNGV